MKRSTFLKRLGLIAVTPVAMTEILGNALKNGKTLEQSIEATEEIFDKNESIYPQYHNDNGTTLTVHSDIRIGDNVIDKILGVKGVVSDVLDDDKFIVAVIGTEGMIVRKAEELYTIYRL